MHMVKVITIRDDVYDRLDELKKKHWMSFSEAIDLLLNEGNVTREGFLAHAGSLNESDIDRRALRKMKRWEDNDESMP